MREGGPASRRLADSRVPLDQIARALKERVYAAFTGLAVVMIYAVGDEPDAAHALRSLVVSIVGISAAGFVAEVIAHQVTHAATPSAAEARTMLRIAAGALASASVPVFALLAAVLGWLDDQTALWIGVGVYVATLAGIALIAVARSGLGWRRSLVSLLGLVGLGALVVGVLALAH
ncbi:MULTISPECIES: hypothetical protein [unclassified Rathayibacter]|uniref:hypothetical protein n=1 Tax=unclassified Rathayibacter TaxID=2609250 RepID=UPI0006FE1C8D|nr:MULTISPECIES: hypothetical protein [unclassified Rathayibacter]KQQ05509.1 hypothetical protein ASF42_02710 [Rathayibacter sp. Leaf294]KQS13372.1 hypothetical protein ASG06_02720 [Rathayibacter sp. Leaf185]